MRFYKILVISLLCCGLFFSEALTPKANAFLDPVTIGILAPIVLPYALQAADFTLEGLVRMGSGFINGGVDVLNLFLLPVGVLEFSLGWPFGFAGDGLKNTGKGLLAPFLLVKEVLFMPLYFSGIINPTPTPLW